MSSKVSIIIPAYNQGKYLGKAIDSLLSQSYCNIEIVVVNDGSTDNTVEVVAGYKDLPNLVYLYQPNSGALGYVRDRGILASSGQYLCFLDSDDFYSPEFIQSMVEILDSDPGLGFAYCDIITVDSNDTPLEDQYSVGAARQELNGDILPSLLLGGYFPPLTVMVRRAALDSIGDFDYDLHGHADYELWLRLSAAGFRCRYLDRNMVYYRSYPESMSKKDFSGMNESRLGSLKKIICHYPERIGESIYVLQNKFDELYSANNWLNEKVQKMARILYPDKTDNYRFIDNITAGQMSSDEHGQSAIWNADIGGTSAQAIFLHPTSRLTFQIQDVRAGTLKCAMVMHPDTWGNQESGSCRFTLRVDGTRMTQIVVDPFKIEDQCWHEVSIQIPATASGLHEIVFETASCSEICSYRWALWRDPIIIWADTAAVENK